MTDLMQYDTPRTVIRDATLADVTADLDRDAVRAVEWAATETVDALALGVRGDVPLGDFYDGSQVREMGV